MKDARSYARKVGVKIKDVYLTMGDNDLVVIVEAPSAENVARFALGVGGYGNVRTRTVQAFTEAELAKLVTDLPDKP